MKVCQFNFNNEVNTFTIHVEDEGENKGKVTVPGENGTVLAEYDSVEQLAEIYAQARDVKPENLKNWVLLQHGDVYSFVLRAGTAGVNVSEVEEQLENVLTSLGGTHHALSIARAREQIMADGTVDLVDALVHCSETEVARDVYDAMSAVINGTEAVEEAVEEEVDNRSDLEKYIDSMEEVPGALNFLAVIAGLTAGAEKAEVLEALNNSFALSHVNSLKAVFDNAVNDAIQEGIGVRNSADALTVITQTAAGDKDENAKARLIAATRMAGRDKVNISVDIVGSKHIRHTAEIVPLDEVEVADLLVRDNVPYIVRFSDTIDEELEAERDAENNTENADIPHEPLSADEPDYEDDYNEDGEEY